jgi:tRNA uridine 5-carboxymethylaminomethyl modification enzyme
MFTSRVEYRLILREDNADLRLGKIGYALGLVSREDYCRIEDKARAIKEGITYLRQNRLKPPQGLSIRKPLTQEEFLKRPGAGIADLQRWGQFEVEISQSVLEQIEIEVKYAGFIQRQLAEVERFKNLEKVRLPQELDYSRINSLSREIKEKLQRFRPINLGQASRISGVTPAAISLLMVYLKKLSLQSSRDSMG